jgi:hypothetical protein
MPAHGPRASPTIPPPPNALRKSPGPPRSTLDLIRDWAHVEFAIDPADMDHTVTMNLRNPTLRQALDAIFLPVGLEYEIDGQRVIVRRR